MALNNCAPGKYNKKSKSCFSNEQITEMAKAYNRYITKKKLTPNIKHYTDSADLINIIPNTKKLLQDIRDKFTDICDGDDMCVTKQEFMNEIVLEMKKDIIFGSFRKTGPFDSNEWLSNIDIDGIMKQYEIVFPNFYFVGAVPLNCDELGFCKLSKINYDELRSKKISYVGVVFNHDKHGEPGSHWVALFIDIDNKEINFCDSTGDPPIDNINSVINKFKKYCYDRFGENPIYKKNKTRYQRDKSECGVYSCNFIIRRLSGETFDEIINNPLDFKQIKSCRSTYFYNSGPPIKQDRRCDPVHIVTSDSSTAL